MYSSVIAPSNQRFLALSLPRSAQAILSIEPDVFFMLSGTGQARNYPGMAWGNGFVINQTAIQVCLALQFPSI